MDDFFEGLIFCILLPALLFLFLFSIIMMADNSDNTDHEKKQDKRYELCLKIHKDWVDGSCITPVK
jgi:hypothetical protein